MRLSSLIVYLGILTALLLGGCSSTPPAATSSPSASPATPSPTTGASVPTPPAGNQPTVASGQDKIAVAASDLIQPVNPLERVKLAGQGRSNPFGLPIDLKPVPPKLGAGQSPNLPNQLQLPKQNPQQLPSLPELPLPPELPNLSGGPKGPKIPNQSVVSLPNLPELPLPPEVSKPSGGPLSSGNKPKPSGGPLSSGNKPKPSEAPLSSGNKPKISRKPSAPSRPNLPKVPEVNIPNLPELPLPPKPDVATNPSGPNVPKLPAIPQPDLARATEVSGVVQVGNTTQVIVRAPNELTTRYVSVGQKLANGQVIIKRVEMNPGGDPVVILEQNGIEVAKTIGEKPTTSGTSDAPGKSTPHNPSQPSSLLTPA